MIATLFLACLTLGVEEQVGLGCGTVPSESLLKEECPVTGWRIADVLLEWTHIAVIVVNLTFWMWRRTRWVQVVVIHLTAISWLIMGWAVGMLGYCWCTDIHWQIKHRLGEVGLPNSFIVYLFHKYTPWQVSAQTADTMALAGFVVALLASYVTLFLFWRERKGQASAKAA